MKTTFFVISCANAKLINQWIIAINAINWKRIRSARREKDEDEIHQINLTWLTWQSQLFFNANTKLYFNAKFSEVKYMIWSLTTTQLWTWCKDACDYWSEIGSGISEEQLRCLYEDAKLTIELLCFSRMAKSKSSITSQKVNLSSHYRSCFDGYTSVLPTQQCQTSAFCMFARSSVWLETWLSFSWMNEWMN